MIDQTELIRNLFVKREKQAKPFICIYMSTQKTRQHLYFFRIMFKRLVCLQLLQKHVVSISKTCSEVNLI